MTIPRILLTSGEPAGVGPDVLIQAIQQDWPADIIAIGDPELFASRARLLGLNLEVVECDLTADKAAHKSGHLRVFPIKLEADVIPGQLEMANSAYVIDTLHTAANACLYGQADAIATAPVQKSIINQAGIDFSGHTEFFAEISSTPQTVMMFVIDNIRAALVTTHMPLLDVSKHITREKLVSVMKVLHSDLIKYFDIKDPTILVTGLNPHAGESGHLGTEEVEIISPILAELREQGVKVAGPVPADTAFLPDVIKQHDAILGMYHDQVLPVIKHIGFDKAVNVTLGLPFIRTSVDHGTALDIAGTGKSNPGSMIAAIQLAIEMNQ